MDSERTNLNGQRKLRITNRTRSMFFLGFVGMLFFGWIVFPFLIYRSVDQPIQFSHRTHTGDNVGLTCGDCHVYDGDGRFAGIPSIEKCSSCHSSPIGTSAEEEKLVDRYIRTGKEIPWVVYSRQPENVYFSHAAHVKLGGLECRSCHFGHGYTDALRPARFSRISGYSLDIFGKTPLNEPSTVSTGMSMDDCAGCHSRHGIKNSCIDCHK